MTKVYFVRHSKPDFSIEDDMTRPLTEEGLKACEGVTDFLSDKDIDRIFSSPFKRSYDTIKGLSDKIEIAIEVVGDFRERKISNSWIDDFNSFTKNQWSDFSFKLENGENLKEVQCRNIRAFKKVIEDNEDRNIVIGSHGTAMSTIINHYDPTFTYKDFERIKSLMPFIVEMEFKGLMLVSMREVML
ncbi:MAG: histidine phosphatase family protein [Acidaminobacteraceae bacterium]